MNIDNPTFETTTSKEWIVTNGIGGYASSTICGANTRRYHGLLVASRNPPTERSVLVSGVTEFLLDRRDTCLELSTNQYVGAIHPKGYQYLKSVERSPLFRTVYQVGDQLLAKTIFMVQGSNTTIIEYENIGQGSYALKIQPFFVSRDYHSLFHESGGFNYKYEQNGHTLKIFTKDETTPLFVKFSSGNFHRDPNWFRNLKYQKEEYRGLDAQEDRYSIGYVKDFLKPGEKLFLTLTTEEKILTKNSKKLKKQELNRIAKLSASATIDDPFYKDLKVAGDQLVVHRKSTDSFTILAGYHWFTDWGRDTMIAMRGLTIATGNKKASQSILETFFSYLSEGMLPNRFPDNKGEDVEYNTIDATLWLFIALYEYDQKFNDAPFIKKHFDKLTEIIEAHIRGTRYNIHLTEEGFIYGGEGIAQLTWMDARVGDHVVTPRHGCPVEIQALWYNALNIYVEFKNKFKIKNNENVTKAVAGLILKFNTNFKKHFWNKAGYLNDVVNPGESTDEKIRPNQIYAISLPFDLLDKKEAQQVFEKVTKELYTPYGLRTLSQDDPDFKPVYGGDQWNRDTAYHQGTVWPFLLMDYFMAQLKIYRRTKKLKTSIRKEMKTLESHFYESGCIHGISEIFDGKDPKEARGTVQQAWSIAALMKVFIDGEL